MTTRSYLDYLDLSKGIGILLVIIGHGILSNFGINVFHMPLFFFLTGLTFTPPNLTTVDNFTIKKINRIVIPWIFFSLISALIEIVVGKLNPSMPFNGPLWFLQTLILALSIYTILRMAINREYILHILVASLPIKLTLVLISYAVTLVFCVLAILLCKRYLPKLTGYDNLIPIA